MGYHVIERRRVSRTISWRGSDTKGASVRESLEMGQPPGLTQGGGFSISADRIDRAAVDFSTTYCMA